MDESAIWRCTRILSASLSREFFSTVSVLSPGPVGNVLTTLRHSRRPRDASLLN